MVEIKDFVKVENGELVIDKDAYEKALNSELDRERTKASTTARTNAEKELKDKLRIELAEEAKLTAEEKLKKEYEAKEKILLDKAIALNKKEIETIYKSAGFTEAEIENLVDGITDDAKSIEKATKLAEARKQAFETKKAEWDKEIGLNQPKPNGQKAGGAESQATQLAKSFRAQPQEIKL